MNMAVDEHESNSKKELSMKKLCLLILIVCLAFAVSFAAEKYTGPYNPERLNSFFKGVTTEGGTAFDFNECEAEFWTGSFTAPGAQEAVIIVNIPYASRAEGITHVWLMKARDEKLVPSFSFYSGDDASLTFVDVQGDGKEEVFIKSSSAAQGTEIESAKLYTFVNGKPKVIFQYSEENSSWGEESEESISHEISFQDIDGDGIIEIIDKIGGAKSIYRLVDGVYKL